MAWVNEDDAVANPGHKWGPAFFHYTQETYHAQLQAISDLF
ncbi:hypothetical protein GCM10009715_43590 [Paeniglutamicibacter psychrophenolicus]|uniref:Uncharacterized protein n=1 Tax=Paeniglutamicibacter psychrophenolicus TaxID=257454 RepID=A0ABS4WE03_9MICC|nr:hypothetical protein [Paeniglutamicibacter psychrophenolicus]